MSKLFNDTRIYLKDSDKVRLADYRARIVRETNPREPCDNEDLVFEKAKSIEDVPNDALKAWQFNPTGEWFSQQLIAARRWSARIQATGLRKSLKSLLRLKDVSTETGGMVMYMATSLRSGMLSVVNG